MLSVPPSLRDHAGRGAGYVVPAVLFLVAFVVTVGTSNRHSLTTSALAWSSICIMAHVRSTSHSIAAATHAQKLAWASGGLLALASVCERSASRRDIWWAKALIPATTYAILKTDIFNGVLSQRGNVSPSISQKPSSASSSGSRRLLLLLTASAVAALRANTDAMAVFALGCCIALLTAASFALVQDAQKEAAEPNSNSEDGAAMNSIMPHVIASQVSEGGALLSVVRDVAMGAAAMLWPAVFALEDLTFARFRYAPLVGHDTTGHTVLILQIRALTYALVMILVHITFNTSLITVVVCHGQLPSAFILLAATLSAQVVTGFSLSAIWFSAICVVSLLFLLEERAASSYFPSTDDRLKMKAKRAVFLLGSASLAGLALIRMQGITVDTSFLNRESQPGNSRLATALGDTSPDALNPLKLASSRAHPVDQLVRDAETDFKSLVQRQSQSLEEAVAEYKRRYQIHPPPNFDKWYRFAKQKKVQLIDEYDTIHHSLLPFWALKPETIRARVREAIGFDGNNLIALLLRKGQPAHVHGGQEWQQEATIGMMKQFVEYLPDMDLAFNIHDEPRVVVPHDELSQLIARAKSKNMPAAFANLNPRNKFSPRPQDVNSGRRIDEVKTTRFNVFAHQPTWIPSRLSCSPDSPARALDDDAARDNLTAYALSDLGFIYNHTAFSDICNSPSFSTSHGFFDRPNAFNVVHDLFPVFSQSKMSSFQDILYPSPWYWYGKVAYDEVKDHDWKAKENKLWWVGSTTGGFSRDGGWRRQHRQQVVRKLNALDTAKILHDQNLNTGGASGLGVPDWQPKDVPRQDYQDIIDVHFSHVGQCDPGDCDAQREFFTIVPPADQQDAWKYKYLLDLDGNAFSGRFYAFLKSKSLVFKMAVFREWHEEWLKPWVHYIPLSLRGEESLETVRYFSAEEEGKAQAIRLAEQGRQWAGKVLRNEDFEVWFFRLMLEYGRVIDDARESIGYQGS